MTYDSLVLTQRTFDKGLWTNHSFYVYCAILLTSFPQAGFGPVEREGRTAG